MLILEKSTNQDPNFLALVKQLDNGLKITDGDDHDFYNQYNGLEKIQHILVGYLDKKPVCCGAFKTIDTQVAEIKRMYTIPEARGKGLAKEVLQTLEVWAKSEGFLQLVLETGVNQHAAIKLYNRCGYNRIPNYGPYSGVVGSLCFGKSL